MSTVVYMVRHGDSPKDGNERSRGLTQRGYLDAERISGLLIEEKIDVVVSSPYLRSVLTVQQLAGQIGQEVRVFEDLKERVFSFGESRVSDEELLPLLEKSFSDPDLSLDGAESNAECQRRAVRVLNEILDTYRGRKVVIGTHGAVMTLMMSYFDSRFDLDFLHSTSKPDIYKMEFDEKKLVNVRRLWGGN
ncbi:histidine phosphatase family protein [Sutcliffiella horikoshii]|uniref:histidine phosphatase family protein n=1 Tax=Sutcliffiella horikoshii TaxID=79883 RepID=UPI00384E6E88